MPRLPQTRRQNIIEQDLEKELLVYDLSNHNAYCLNETSRIIYLACNGETTFDELKRKYKFTDDLIYFALNDLRERNLVDDYQPQSFLNKQSRREAIRKIGFTSMIAIPLITSLVAPTAVSAQSGPRPLNAICTSSAQCQTNFCTANPGRCCVAGTQPVPFTAGQSFCGACDATLCCSGNITNSGPGACGGAGDFCTCN